MRASPRLSRFHPFHLPSARILFRKSLAIVLALGAALALASCKTVSTSSGRIDSSPGRVAGNFYYLPKGLFRIRGGFVEKEYTITVSVIYVADPRRRFYLEPRHNAFYDDDYKLQINSKGLLDTVQVTAADRTADIVGDVAQVAAGSLKFAAGAGVGTFGAATATKPLEPFDYTFDIGEAADVRARLNLRGFDLHIIAHESAGATHSRFPLSENATELAAGGKETSATHRARERIEAAGIIFRPARAYTVRITDLPYRRRLAAEMQQQAAAAQTAATRSRQLGAGAGAEATAQIEELERRAASFQAAAGEAEAPTESLRVQTTVLVPDENTQLLFAFGRTPFIKRSDNLVFNDGMLTKIDGSRPSPIVGFLEIPKKIVTAIVPLPLELKNTQITNLKAARTLETLRHPEVTEADR